MTEFDEYMFWYNVNYIANNLDKITTIREDNWLENLSFKKDLNNGLKVINNLIEITTKLKIKANPLGV